jgi:hypothetical protein
MGRDLVQEGVAGDDGLHQQGLQEGQLIFECGESQEVDDVHWLQTIGQTADDRYKAAGFGDCGCGSHRHL